MIDVLVLLIIWHNLWNTAVGSDEFKVDCICFFILLESFQENKTHMRELYLMLVWYKVHLKQ